MAVKMNGSMWGEAQLSADHRGVLIVPPTVTEAAKGTIHTQLYHTTRHLLFDEVVFRKGAFWDSIRVSQSNTAVKARDYVGGEMI